MLRGWAICLGRGGGEIREDVPESDLGLPGFPLKGWAPQKGTGAGKRETFRVLEQPMWGSSSQEREPEGA